MVQVVTPVIPVMDQVPVPDGTTAPLGPTTVAVNVTGAPRVAVGEFARTVIVGDAGLTVVEAPEVGEVGV